MDEITQNPFNDIREAKTLKYMMRRKDGSLYEFDMSILTKPFEEMSNMELVLAWIKAHQIFDLLEKKMQAYTETDEYSFRDWKKAVKLDKETYAVERLAEEFLFEKFQMESHILESKSERLQSARLGLHPGEWVQTPATVLCPWDDENYNPGYVYSYRILQPKIKKHTGEGSVDITEFLVSDITGRSQDEKQKRRLLIEFNTYTASTSGSHYKKKWPYAMMITRTKDGLRIMWVRVRGKKGQKFIFGASYSMMERKKLVPKVGRSAGTNPIPLRIYEYLHQTTEVADWLPITKYITATRMNFDIAMLHPFGIDMSLLYWVGGCMDVKEIINKAYGKSGVNGVTKHMFGGRNNIDSLVKLRVAIWWARVLRDFPSTVFNNIDLDLHFPPNLSAITTHPLPLVMIKTEEETRRFFKMFGAKQAYIDDLMDPTKEDDTYYLDRYAHRLYTPISYMQDVVSAMKSITNKTHRTAIITHVKNNSMTIREIHDYVIAEHAKIKQENRKLKNTVFNKKFLKHQGTWINDDIQVIVPTQTHDLVEWGAAQENCIGTYGDIVVNGSSMILGFKDRKGNWIGHAEITSAMQLRQLLGRFNAALEDEHRKPIVKFINQKLDVNVSSTYLGAN